MTEQLHFHFSLSCTGEGNGNPLQCSCLENPRDGGAWWAAVYGVTQSQTRLKQLRSSSSSTERANLEGTKLLFLSQLFVISCLGFLDLGTFQSEHICMVVLSLDLSSLKIVTLINPYLATSLTENNSFFASKMVKWEMFPEGLLCCCLVTMSCSTLCDPMDCGPPGSSVHGISQARILEWVAISFSRGFFQTRDQISSALADGFFPTATVLLSHLGSP